MPSRGKVGELAGCTVDSLLAIGTVCPKPTCQPVHKPRGIRTYLDQVTGHLAETGETIPYLTDDGFPNLCLGTSVTLLCSYFLAENPL
jgi:hypothetical protein